VITHYNLSLMKLLDFNDVVDDLLLDDKTRFLVCVSDDRDLEMCCLTLTGTPDGFLI
jgi:hypothetical protein